MSEARGLLAANALCSLSIVIWAAGLPAAGVVIPLLHPIDLNAARMTLAAIALLPIWLWWDGAAGLGRATWFAGLWVGAILAFATLCLIVGQSLAGPVTVAVVSASLPLIGMALEVVLDGRRLTPALILGLALSVVGGLVALDSLSGAGLGPGALLVLASVLCYALGSRLTVTRFPDLTPLGRTAITLFGAAVAGLVLSLIQAALIRQVPDFSALGLREWSALAVFGIGSLAMSQLLWIISVGRLGIGVSALHINAAPFYVMAILYALGDAWVWLQALGAAIVVLGVLVAQGMIPLKRRPASP